MTENSGKTTLSVDEDDILRYAEKIRLNHQEDKAFEEIIVRFVDVSQDKINEQITIGKTPYSLVLAGADGDLPLTISPETIIKCMGDANEVYHGHSLSEEIMKQLPGELRVPTLILKGSHKNSLVAVTELRDEENNIIIAAVELNSRRARQEVNRVTSAYGKNNVQQYIDRQVNKEHNLIACNKEKADKMFQSLGLQLPPEETFIGFDNSIAFSSENVKGFSEIILENIPPRKENDMENKQNSADNAPREEITDTDLVVGLVESGFHVYLDDTDRQLTFEKIYDYFDDYGRLKDGHTFTVPMMEVAQFGALEALCEKFESFNDIVRADGGLHADSGLPGLSLKDYADELLDDEESHFEWRNGQSEWENVRRGILLGETKFLHNFLYDAAFDYPSRAADIREDLNDYETTNFKEKQTDKTFAYDIGHSAPFTVVHLDVSTEERKNAVSQALKTIINSFGERNDMSQPYKNLLEDIKPTVDFLDASQGHLSALKYALRNAETNKELCLSMLDSIKIAENSPEKTVIIKGYDCLPKDAWENNGIKFTIGQSVDDMSFYYARATDGKITRDYEYDYEPDKEKVMSDHADKLAQEDMDCGEAIYGADGHRAFPDPEMKHLVVFEYNGYHFEPIGKIDSKSTLREIGNAIVSNKGTLDMSVYQGSRLPYSYEKFYAAANSEADVFRCIENGKLYLPGENELFEYTGEILSLAKEKAVEHIPQTQDISHKTTNADLSATRGNNINNNAELSAARMTLGHSNANGQKRSIIMSNNTKLGVSSMTISDDENSAIKAFAAVTVNDEFVIKNIKVIEGDKGLFVAMPSRKISGEYQDVVFPITKEAREQLNNAVEHNRVHLPARL